MSYEDWNAMDTRAMMRRSQIEPDMITVTAAEMQEDFAKYRELARSQPLSVTHHGHDDLVMMSVAEYNRLKSLDDREVFFAGDIPSELLRQIADSEPPAWTKELDRLMDR